MKRNKGGEVRCKHEQCITWDTNTEYGEMVKCVTCGYEMQKHNWIVLQALRGGESGNRFTRWLKNIDPLSIDAGVVYFMAYILVMLIYGYYSL